MKNIKLLFIIILLFNAVTVYSQINVGKHFNEYFEFVKEIKLPDDFIAEFFTSIDVYGDNIVIADKYVKKAYLLTDNGKIIKKLNSDDCHPGIQWVPYHVFFNKKGDIYLTLDNPPWGFLFDKNGKCLGPADKSFFYTLWCAFTKEDQIIAYNHSNLNNKNSLILLDKKGKIVKEFSVFPEKYKNIIRGTYGGGLVTDKDDNIYLLTPPSYEILKYDKNGNSLKTLKCKPFWYIAPERDKSNSMDMQQKIQEMKIMSQSSSAERLYLLDKDILAAEYWYKGKLELVLCDLEGNRLNKNPINYEKQKSLFAKNGMLYFVDEKTTDKKGEPINPTIKVYRYKTNMRGK